MLRPPSFPSARSQGPALALAVLLFGVLPLLAPPSAGAAAWVGHVRLATDQYAQFPNYAQTAARNGFVILQPYQTDKLHALKAANPNVKVLMYQNAGAASTLAPANQPDSGVSFGQAKANGWLLHDSSTGQPFTFNGYPQLWAADVGSHGYHDAWEYNVLRRLKSDAWDGVFMDDVDATMKYNYANPQNVQEYPTDQSYAAATGSFLASIGPRLKAEGELVVANIGAWVEYPDAVRPWLPYLSGAMDEKYLKFGATTGEGYRGFGQWLTEESEIRDTEAAGAFFLGITDSDPSDEAAAVYAYASALLVSNGHAYVSLVHDYSVETWFSEYDIALGTPAGASTGDANGVGRRRFSRGLVLVNPTDAPLYAGFGGVYSGSGLTAARGATLAAHTGLVLSPGAAPITTPENFPQSGFSALTTGKHPAPRRLVMRTRHALRVQAEALGVPRGARIFADRRAQGGRAVLYTRRAALVARLRFGPVRKVQIRARMGCRASARVVVRIGRSVVLSRRVTSRRWTLITARPHRVRRLRALRVDIGPGVARRCASGLRLDALALSDLRR